MKTLLRCLQNGEIHSGESLGRRLGISRAAVWKQIQQLEQLGLSVQSHKGQGYQLLAPMDLLDETEITSLLSQPLQKTLSDIRVLFETDSTNTRVLQIFREREDGKEKTALASPVVVLAEKQSAGRGRRGKQWFSPLGSSIYLTVGWAYVGGLSAIEGLSLVVGLKIVQALEKYGAKGLALKWPNDVLWRGQKIAGVLIDVQGDPMGETQVAIGIGLNVHLPQAVLDAQQVQIDQPWADITTVLSEPNKREVLKQQPPSRNKLVAALLNELVPALSEIEEKGFSAYQKDWQGYDYCLGKVVNISTGQEQASGTACGINAQGAYEVETAQGRQVISGGEISLRLAQKKII